MNLTKIDAANTYIAKYDIYNNKSQVKTDGIHFMESPTINDYVDFSIDYTENGVSTILSDIKDYFYNSDYMSNNTSIVECTAKYGEMLKRINSNSEFDDNAKSQLTKILDNSFDYFAEKRIKELGDNISNFFNRAFNMKEVYEKQGTNMGIKGDKVINEEAVLNNIKNMFLGAKTFYKNNLNGTTEQLDKFLQDKFSKTESIEKLSYNDFKSLQEAFDIVKDDKNIITDISVSGYTKRQSELMNAALENLKKQGTSSILTNAFEKAIIQNNTCNKRIKAYVEIRAGYEKQLEDLMMDQSKNELKLKELDKKRKKMIEEYNKEMSKLQYEMYKLNMFNMRTGQNNGKHNAIENLTKQHIKQLQNLDNKQIQIENSAKEIAEKFKETAENFNTFMKNPAASIDNYLDTETA